MRDESTSALKFTAFLSILKFGTYAIFNKILFHGFYFETKEIDTLRYEIKK